MVYFNGKLNYYLDKMSKEELEEYCAFLLDILDSYRSMMDAQSDKIHSLEQLYKDQDHFISSYISTSRLTERINKFADSIRDLHQGGTL